MVVLVCCFAGQTFLVYTDPPTGTISESALHGRQLWHSKNCQSCHQLYGFGGFLGPDLTNAASRIPRSRLEGLLRDGFGAMPAFHLTDREIDSIESYLLALDATGVGHSRNPALRGIQTHEQFTKVVEEALLGNDSDQLEEGVALSREFSCHSCHQPFRAMGPFPDVTTAFDRLTREEIEATLEEGPGIMPAFDLTEGQRDSLLNYLEWLSTHRDELQTNLALSVPRAPIKFRELPWWEYSR